jgi:hypothetical protein
MARVDKNDMGDNVDSGLSASQLRLRYHYGGMKGDAELSASQLRSRYEVIGRMTTSMEEGDGAGAKANVRISARGDESGLLGYESGMRLLPYRGGAGRSHARSPSNESSILRSIHCTTAWERRKQRKKCFSFVIRVLTVLSVTVLGAALYVIVLSPPSTRSASGNGLFPVLPFRDLRAELRVDDDEYHRREDGYNFGVAAESAPNYNESISRRLDGHRRPTSTFSSSPSGKMEKKATWWERACGTVFCVGDSVTVEMADLPTTVGAVGDPSGGLCSATIVLVAEEQQRLVRILPDGWAGQAAFWLDESDRAIRQMRRRTYRKHTETGFADRRFPSTYEDGSSVPVLDRCPYSLASLGEDSVSLSVGATCSVAIRDYCEIDAAPPQASRSSGDAPVETRGSSLLPVQNHASSADSRLPATITNHSTSLADRRVAACTTRPPPHNPDGQTKRFQFPTAWLDAQAHAATIGLCPDPAQLVWPADRWSFPDCSAAMRAKLQDRGRLSPSSPSLAKSQPASHSSLWEHAQSQLADNGICPRPEIFKWLPDFNTHPTCGQCMSDRCGSEYARKVLARSKRRAGGAVPAIPPEDNNKQLENNNDAAPQFRPTTLIGANESDKAMHRREGTALGGDKITIYHEQEERKSNNNEEDDDDPSLTMCGAPMMLARAWAALQTTETTDGRAKKRLDGDTYRSRYFHGRVLDDFFAGSQRHCSSSSATPSWRSFSEEALDGSSVHEACPAPELVRWAPDASMIRPYARADFFTSCADAMLEECHRSEIDGSAEAFDDPTNSNPKEQYVGLRRRSSSPRMENVDPAVRRRNKRKCKRSPIDWRTSDELDDAIQAQRAAAARGLCPWPFPRSAREKPTVPLKNGLDRQTNRSRSLVKKLTMEHDLRENDERKKDSNGDNKGVGGVAGFLWHSHSRVLPRSALSVRYCEL